MRERSHEKGKAYQRESKRWLANVPLFGLTVRPHGDAYDTTANAAKFGGKQYDFSLAMHEAEHDEKVIGVLYVECKFRESRSGSTLQQFDRFLHETASAFRSESPPVRRSAKFLFVASIPPSSWQQFLRDRIGYWRKVAPDALDRLAEDDIALLSQSTAAIVLPMDLMGGAY